MSPPRSTHGIANCEGLIVFVIACLVTALLGPLGLMLLQGEQYVFGAMILLAVAVFWVIAVVWLVAEQGLVEGLFYVLFTFLWVFIINFIRVKSG